jgi:aspartyl-tRNA(Asn)/glutamyl-tRNA(Gln) amidotransferase subunit B
MANNFQTIIGLEVHAQLSTKSKMFCGCGTDYAGAPPNTHVCPVCLGMPGVLPVVNKRAVELTVMTALALHCRISNYARFDRKNYSYPDLMKGYQISQSYFPFGQNGWMDIEVDGKKKRIGINNVHLEEDVAKLTHWNMSSDTYSLVDVNRAGSPLMEIVGDPDLRSPEEARQYLMTLRSILQYIGASEANMEEGSFRCDANISILPEGQTKTTNKVEVKNMNSFRAVFKALEFEEERIPKVYFSGGRLPQETRGWVEESNKTVSLRSKEYANDYRYFPEPDLPPIVLSDEAVEDLRRALPELPDARRDRFVQAMGLPVYDAGVLTATKDMADYFETCLETPALKLQPLQERAKAVSNWLLGEFQRMLNATNSDVTKTKVKPEALGQLIVAVQKGTISGTSGKEVFEEMFNTGKAPSDIISSRGLSQISNTDEIDNIIKQVIAANPQPVADFKAGKAQALTFLVGQVMRASKGRANAKIVNDLMKKKLEEG